MKDFRRLNVWRKAHGLTLDVYKATRTFPPEELYGLTSQLRRSSFSIPANVAEGCGRRTDSDFGRFLTMAMGSASEVEYFLLLSHDLGLLESARYDSLARQTIEVKRMLAALIAKIRMDG